MQVTGPGHRSRSQVTGPGHRSQVTGQRKKNTCKFVVSLYLVHILFISYKPTTEPDDVVLFLLDSLFEISRTILA